MKTLDNVDIADTKQKVSDVKVVGNVDMFQLLCKASSESEGWMKSAKAMQTPTGCFVQITTQQRNPDGSYVVGEAMAFGADLQVVDDVNDGRKLVRARS